MYAAQYLDLFLFCLALLTTKMQDEKPEYKHFQELWSYRLFFRFMLVLALLLYVGIAASKASGPWLSVYIVYIAFLLGVEDYKYTNKIQLPTSFKKVLLIELIREFVLFKARFWG